jgi:hypothetical protein
MLDISKIFMATCDTPRLPDRFEQGDDETRSVAARLYGVSFVLFSLLRLDVTALDSPPLERTFRWRAAAWLKLADPVAAANTPCGIAARLGSFGPGLLTADPVAAANTPCGIAARLGSFGISIGDLTRSMERCLRSRSTACAPISC